MTEPLAVLLLPCPLEQFALEDHVRGLLSIPRVVALEPSRFRTPRLLREAAPFRQARRLRFPGEPRMLILYHPGQFRLARALSVRYERSELWYVRLDLAALDAGRIEELRDLDRLACERASELRVISRHADIEQPLRVRLRELEIISPRPFVPWARIGDRQ